MSEHDYILANAAGATFRADLNLALLAIVSNNSKATEPTATYAYMWWYDTTNNLLKMRNADDDAWISVGTFDQTNDLFTPFISDPKSAYRSKFVFKDIDEIYLDGGMYRHVGTKTQILEWLSKLTYQFTSLTASTWSYLYFDNSAIVSAGTNVITTTELVDYTQAPDDFDPAKGGYFHPTYTDDMCLFAVLANSSGEIIEFMHVGDLIMWADAMTIEVAVNGPSSFTDISPFVAPSFTDKILAYVRWDFSNNQAGLWWRTKGQTGAVGHEIAKVAGASVRSSNQFIAITDSDHIIQIKEDTSSGNDANFNQDGWFLPIGM